MSKAMSELSFLLKYSYKCTNTTLKVFFIAFSVFERRL